MKPKIRSLLCISIILSLLLVTSVIATRVSGSSLPGGFRGGSGAKPIPTSPIWDGELPVDLSDLSTTSITLNEDGIVIPSWASTSDILDMFKKVSIIFDNIIKDSRDQLYRAYCSADDEEEATVKLGLAFFSVAIHTVQLQAQSFVGEYAGRDESTADHFRALVLRFSEYQLDVSDLISDEPNLERLCPSIFPYSDLLATVREAERSGVRPGMSPFDRYHLGADGHVVKDLSRLYPPSGSSGSSGADGSSVGDGSSSHGDPDSGDSSGSSGDGSSGSSGSGSGDSGSPGSITNTHSRNSAEDALEEAQEELEDADNAIDDAKEAWRRGLSLDVDDDDIDDAKEDMDRAWDLYEDAERLVEQGYYDLAIQKADQAKDLAEDVIRDMDYTSTSSYQSSRSSGSDNGNTGRSSRRDDYDTDRTGRSSTGSTGYVFQSADEYLSEGSADEEEPVIIVRSQQSVNKPVNSASPASKNLLAGIFLFVTAVLALSVIIAAVLVLRKSAKEE